MPDFQARLHVGTGPNDLLQLDSDGRVPTVDGRHLLSVVTSLTDGDWKKITAMAYNPDTGKIRIIYDDT